MDDMTMTSSAEPHDHPGDDLDEIAARAEELVGQWLRAAEAAATAQDRRTAEQLHGVVADPAGVAFTMRFVDRVIRPDDDAVAADQLATLVDGGPLPSFLGPVDRLLLRAGGFVGPRLPRIVMPLARRRLRSIVGHLVVDADPDVMARHFSRRRSNGFGLNVNLLGEAVLGDREATRRYDEAMKLLAQPDVDYVSVKVSAIVSQLNPWDHEGSIQRILGRLRPLLLAASRTSPPTFVNLDMEEYHDLELTIDAFTRVLDQPDLHHIDAGIVLQAYLPDSFEALRLLVTWAQRRRDRTIDGRAGGAIKIRLVKGANLAMEQVDAAIHGWEQAPYRTKAETDANYKRCLDWLLRPDHLDAVRVGVGSHNLFDCAFAHLLATERGVADAVTIEMLEGMANAHARVARDATGGLLLYTPVVDAADFDVAISYLFRRLEENTSEENFIRHLFDLEPGGDQFRVEAERFRRAVSERWTAGTRPQRDQNRRAEADREPDLVAAVPAPGASAGADDGVVEADHGSAGPSGGDDGFVNEPDTDPSLAPNRRWMAEVLAAEPTGCTEPITEDPAVVDEVVGRIRSAQPAWWSAGGRRRRSVLRAVGDELARRRGDLIQAMADEGNKTVAQADPEVSEAIDFARYYAERAVELDPAPDGRGVEFSPFGIVAVVPPWNFPVAIPAGGVLAALAAGNGVVLKPAPETPRCAEIVAECCWTAGVPPEVLAFVRTRDDDTGRHLVAHPDLDAVILTGGYETAQLFRSWRPERPLMAETSGKNALVVTPSADIDLAVADLVASAFGHGGQKCSAASLAIGVGGVIESPRFRRQLLDAVSSLGVGPATDLGTDLAPLIGEPTGKLHRALTELEPGETWLVEPRRHDDGLWSPGVRLGVRPGSWFHQTECFGPVLGLMGATDLDEAIEWQNGTAYGLTGGLHSLDPEEIDHWLERVEVGNAYVNRVTTGAIVRRQPFGGWKRSSVGPGAKAGGPNYVAQLGRWRDRPPDPDPGDGGAESPADGYGDAWLAAAERSDAEAWARHFAVGHDPTDLFCEENTFRYRPLPAIAVRVEPDTSPAVVTRVTRAAAVAGVPVRWSRPDVETQVDLAARLASLGAERVRVLGAVGDELRSAAIEHDVHLADDPVTADGRRELLHYLREQAISRTTHRYGNVLS